MLVSVERRDDGVAVLRLDNPKVNAMSTALLTELREAADGLTADPPGAVVVTGGDRVFAAGADISEFGGPEEGRIITTAIHDALRALSEIPRLVIAAVAGYALGGGCELALACDYRVASERAVFGQPEILLGIIPGGGGTQRLPRLVGPARAKEIMITGRQVKADEALRIGFVDRVVPGDQLIEETNRYLTELLANVAPRSIATIKRQVYAGWSQTFAQSSIETKRVLDASLDHPDLKEGVASFVERRPPRFAPVGPDDRHPSPSTAVHSDNDLLGGHP